SGRGEAPLVIRRGPAGRTERRPAPGGLYKSRSTASPAADPQVINALGTGAPKASSAVSSADPARYVAAPAAPAASTRRTSDHPRRGQARHSSASAAGSAA